MTLTLGQKLKGGKYTIEKKLGEGGFGITYLAREQNGQRAVIKTLNDTVQRQRDFAKFQQDFLNEALRLAKCTHPHIVQAKELIQEGALWCIVMEYIDGENLASRVENRGILPEAEALLYIHQVGDALRVVHNQGLLHRDIKPQNIMLRASKSEAVLIDFGVAREFTPNLTQTHTVYRTKYFAPIEQYDRRARRGAYTDVYALAATLYVILTGELPVTATDREDAIRDQQDDLLVPPKAINSNISDKVNQAILKGMAFQPEERPQSMQAWLELLGVKNVAVNPGNQRQGNTISAPPQRRVEQPRTPVASKVRSPHKQAGTPSQPQTRIIPWVRLTTVLLTHTVQGLLLAIFYIPGVSTSGAWDWIFFPGSIVVLTWSVAVAPRDNNDSWWGIFGIFVPLLVWGRAFEGNKNLAVTVVSFLAFFATMIALVWSMDKLKSINSLRWFHIFLIFTVTSLLGLVLGWLAGSIFR